MKFVTVDGSRHGAQISRFDIEIQIKRRSRDGICLKELRSSRILTLVLVPLPRGEEFSVGNKVIKFNLSHLGVILKHETICR